MSDAIITNYTSADCTGTVPNKENLDGLWLHVKSGNLYKILDIGFNTHSQRWEYEYVRKDGVVRVKFHRTIEDFHMITSLGSPRFIKVQGSENIQHHGV